MDSHDLSVAEGAMGSNWEATSYCEQGAASYDKGEDSIDQD